MKTNKKIILFLSIFFFIIVSIIIGRAIINSKIEKAIKKARGKPSGVIAYSVKESSFFQSIETFGTAIANKSFSIRIKKENIIKSIDFNKQQFVKKSKYWSYVSGVKSGKLAELTWAKNEWKRLQKKYSN